LRSARNEQEIRQGAGIMPDDGRSCTERERAGVPFYLARLGLPLEPKSVF
jgi:hypothetical protein